MLSAGWDGYNQGFDSCCPGSSCLVDLMSWSMKMSEPSALFHYLSPILLHALGPCGGRVLYCVYCNDTCKTMLVSQQWTGLTSLFALP